MERNGGVVTEFNICFPQRFSLDTYSTGNSKMCKDDVIPSLFCNSLNSDHLNMERSGFKKSAISLEDLDRAQTGCIDSDERMFSVIQQQSDHALNNCYLPAWENSEILSYQPPKLTNGGLTPNLVISDSDTTSDSVRKSRIFDDNTNSSVEEVYPFLCKQPPKEEKSEVPKPAQSKQLGGSTNKDRSMPELIPLICVEDDDPVKVPEEKMVPESKLTDSPEMPKLIAFSSEEAFRVKMESQEVDKCRSKVELFGGSFLESLADRSGGRSPGGLQRQPQVVLRRVSLEQCGEKNGGSSTEELENEDKMPCVRPSDDDGDSLSGPFKHSGKNSSNETPEIEEIEGVRFFQFRSKSDMEEFHEQRKAKAGDDVEMIVPTKTADITQIKGWRHKYFAPESEFQYPITLETIRAAESVSLGVAAPAAAPSGDENGAAESSDKGAVVETPSPADKSKDPDFLKDTKPSMEDLMVLPRPPPSFNGPVPIIDLTTNNPQSAFESKILDDYLSNAPGLKVSYLEKINPNILPIPRNSSILSLGKLFKPDSQVTTLAALKLRNGIALTTTTSSPDAKIEVGSSPSPPLVRLSDSSDADRSSDDDIPVARLKRPRQRVGKMVVPGRRVKRVKSDVSSDQSQRVVLRLTKESQGESKGYKVSEITAEKQQEKVSSSSTTTSSSSSSSSSSEDDSMQESIQIVPPGKLEILKHSVFMKVSEPRLLDEFLANLNLLGTSNDVAMLVQSNQSYFEKSPVLTEEVCREAVEALVLNKDDKSDFKKSNKPSPKKKKLKAWQRYLPKKLNVSLQQQISKMAKTKAVSSSPVVVETPSAAPHLEGKPRKKKKRLGKKAKLAMSHVEREKRAIRLPARYLDSAVLAAGTEWVSPVFVEEGEKKLPPVNRKQLLDVLEKISTSKTEVAITQDASETTSECIVTNAPPSFARKLPKSPPKGGAPNKRVKLSSEAKGVDLTNEADGVNPNDQSMKQNAGAKKVKPKDGVKKINKGFAHKGHRNWRNHMKAIDTMVEDGRDPYPFPDCPFTHCTRTLEYDRIDKELGCTYAHKKKKPAPLRTLLCHEKLPSHIEGEERSDASKKAMESVGYVEQQPQGVPLMCNNGNLILTQQVNPPSGGSSKLQLAGDAAANKGAIAAGHKQILLLVSDTGKGKNIPILPKPAPGAPLQWPQPASTNAVWFVQDGELKSSRPAVPAAFNKASQPPVEGGRPPARRRKSPLSVRRDDDSDVDVEGEDFLFDAKEELKRSVHSDFTNEECELIFAALMGEERTAANLSGKSRSEILLMMRSMERLRSKSAHFERARSCDEMLHMAQYIVRESTKLDKAYKCIKKVLRLRNIMLLKKANAMLTDGSKDIDISVVNKIKYELIRTLALEWETQKKERSTLLSEFKSQPEPINAPPEKRLRINEHPNFEMAKESSKPGRRMDFQGSAIEENTTSFVKKLFEPVGEAEVLEEPHVQLRILEAPEGSVDIETQFSVVENELVVQNQVELESTPMEKSEMPPQEKPKTPPQVSDVNNSDDDDLLIIDLSGERSKENSPVKAAVRTLVDSSPNSSILDLSGKQPKESSPVKSTEKTTEDSLKSSKPAPPLKKFPGLIPIYKSDLLNEERLLSGGKGPLGKDIGKSDKSGPRGLATPIPENGRFKRTTISSKPDGWQEPSLQQQPSSSYRQGVDLVKGTLSYDSNYVLPPPGQSSLLHSSNVQHKMVERPLTHSGPPEEIVLDDSDEEPGVDYSKRTHNPSS